MGLMHVGHVRGILSTIHFATLIFSIDRIFFLYRKNSAHYDCWIHIRFHQTRCVVDFFGDESLIAYIRARKKQGHKPQDSVEFSHKNRDNKSNSHNAPTQKRTSLMRKNALRVTEKPFADFFLLLFFVIFGFFLRRALFIGMSWSDDYDYAQLAVMIIEGRFNPVDVGTYNLYAWRFAMIYPLALFFKVFNSTSEHVATLWPIIASLGTSVVLFFLGKKLFDSKTGLAAAILHLLYPSDILFATSILTETPFNFIISLSVLAFVYGEYSTKWYIKLSLFFVSGALLSLLLYGRPYGILILGAYGAFMLMKYIINLRYVALIAGFLCTLYVIEYLIHEQTGRWLENFAVMKRMLDPYFCPTSNIAEHLDYYRKVLFESRLHHPYMYLFIIGSTALLVPAISGNINPTESAAQRNNGFFIIFWLASILLYIEFGFMNFDHMTLMHKMERYLTIISAPLCLGSSVFIARYANRWSFVLTAFLFAVIALWWYACIMPDSLAQSLFRLK